MKKFIFRSCIFKKFERKLNWQISCTDDSFNSYYTRSALVTSAHVLQLLSFYEYTFLMEAFSMGTV